MIYTVRKGIIKDSLKTEEGTITLSKGLRETTLNDGRRKETFAIRDGVLYKDEKELGSIFYREEKSLLQKKRAESVSFTLEGKGRLMKQEEDRSFSTRPEGHLTPLHRRLVEVEASDRWEAARLFAIASLMFHEDDLDIV